MSVMDTTNQKLSATLQHTVKKEIKLQYKMSD